MGGFATVCG